MKACHLIPHPSAVPADAIVSISQQRAACVRDRDLGVGLRRYFVRGRMKQMEKVKERSPWTKVSGVNTRFLFLHKMGQGVGMKRKKEFITD